MKTVQRWFSGRLNQEITVARWGTFGRPVLVFPSAGGDAEEIERFGLVDACGPLLAEGRVKLYSVDSVAGRAMIAKASPAGHRLWLLNQFHECIRWEVVPAIHADLGGQPMDVITTGASIGAFNAVAALCRYPDAFAAAIGMSGTYGIDRFYEGAWTEDLYFASPLQFLPGLQGPQLDELRQRFAVLACGAGDWEDPGESWRIAAGARGERDPQPGGQLGPGIQARLAHLAPDAPAVSARAHPDIPRHVAGDAADSPRSRRRGRPRAGAASLSSVDRLLCGRAGVTGGVAPEVVERLVMVPNGAVG